MVKCKIFYTYRPPYVIIVSYMDYRIKCNRICYIYFICSLDKVLKNFMSEQFRQFKPHAVYKYLDLKNRTVVIDVIVIVHY